MVDRKWYLIDASDVVLGRLSSVVSNILQGKSKLDYSPNKDIGDFVVIENAAKLKLTGKKLIQKISFRHSGYPGGEKVLPYKDLIKTNPEKIVKDAVNGMLPKNRLKAKRFKRLKVFTDKAQISGWIEGKGGKGERWLRIQVK
ncbi:MAG: 50S ribosomal protein L13 [Elusimicrobiota bacterium]